MPRWKIRLVSAGLLAVLAGGCALPPATPPTANSSVSHDGRKSSGTAKVALASAEVAQNTPLQPGPGNNPVIERKAPGVPIPAPVPSPDLQPEVGERFIEPPPIPPTPDAELAIETGQTGPTSGSLTLKHLESLACANNPTLIQAKAQVDATFGKAIQAGLWPNPQVFYVGEQIGIDTMTDTDSPGEFQGAVIQQEFVTADKLDLSRTKYLERVHVAE